jgi:hypothetical protein
MPRRSHEALAARPVADDGLRPDPPDEYRLTDDEIREWWATVQRMERNWFQRETFPLLAQYCRLTVSGHRISGLVHKAEKAEKFDLDEYRKLLRTQSEISKGIAQLATKMRLSQQSSYDRMKRKGVKLVRNPWDD